MTYVQKHTRAGFSLMELMIAVAILGILAIVIIPGFMGYLDKAKKSSTAQNLKMIEQAVDQYYMEIGKYPTRLKDLVQAPLDEKDKNKWRMGGYLGKNQEIPEDGWNSPFQYKVISANKYELYSFGPNGRGAPQSEWIRAK